MRWKSAGAEKVVFHFITYIDDVNSLTTCKGSLTFKEKVEKFIQSHPIFDYQNIPHATKILLIKTKVFNERKKKRETTFKLFK